MRHVGQGHEISVALPEQDLASGGFVEELLARFYTAYESLYGRTVSGSEVEVITWRVRVSGPRSHVTTGKIGGERGATKEPLKGSRPVYFDELGQYVDTRVYDHYALTPDMQIQGPAIIEQRESTVVVGPSATASVDAQQNLIMLLA
jgi:N-methylhydantoinase A